MRRKIHINKGFKVPVYFICFIAGIFMLPSTTPGSDLFQRQHLEIPSSFNPVGSGARALGMGGAFIAVADDATAASWNPGGLIQLERPEISIVGASLYRTEDNSFGLNPEACGKQNISESNLNYMSVAYPFTLFNRNIVVSLNYQHLYDFTKSWDYRLFYGAENVSTFENIKFDQWGKLSAIGLAYAIQATPYLSLGMTLNFWGDYISKSGWKKESNIHSKGYLDFGGGHGADFNYTYYKKENSSFEGFNLNLGFLWNATPRLTIGAVFKTPFTAEIDFDAIEQTDWTFPDFPEQNLTFFSQQSENQKMDMPMSFGIGFSYRFSDNLTVSADIYRTEWDDFVLKDSKGKKKNPITGKNADESWLDPTRQFRMGAEYLFIGDEYVVPLRAGIFYDPAPAVNGVDDFFGFSLGSGIVFERFVFDIAYQYRFGSNVGKSYLEYLDFSQDVNEHTVYSSVIVYF